MVENHGIRPTAYQTQSSEMIKMFHCQLKATLRTYSDFNSWLEFLPVILLGIRTTMKENLQFSTAVLLYGTLLTFLSQIFIGIVSFTDVSSLDLCLIFLIFQICCKI